jgi:hypothetical protein
LREISDEVLMAYADNELAEDLRVRVETYLANDPDGRRRLATFTETREKLAVIFNQPMHEPIPEHLVNMVKTHAGGEESLGPTPKLVRLNRFSGRDDMAPRPWALAATLVILLAAGAGSIIYYRAATDDVSTFGLAAIPGKATFAGNELATALDTTASGGTAVRTIRGEDVSIKPDFTFVSHTSEYCRQYRISRGKMQGLIGVACRETDGAWRVEVQSPSMMRPQTHDGAITPAGKDGVASVDAAVDRLISGDVLGLEDEAQLIRGGWSRLRPQ